MLCGCFPAMEIHICLRCLSARLLSVPVSTVPCGHGNTYRAACYPHTFVHVWILQRFAPSYVRPVYCLVHDAVRILMCKSNLRVQCAQNVQILLFLHFAHPLRKKMCRFVQFLQILNAKFCTFVCLSTFCDVRNDLYWCGRLVRQVLVAGIPCG